MIGAIDHDLIAEKLSAITQLSRKDLVERWTSTNKRPPPKGISRRILEYSAAYQVQVKACGGLSPTIRRKLRRKGPSRHKSSSAPPFPRKSKLIYPGTRLVRDWHGRTYTVEVMENAFQYNNETYGSLSKVAHAITGARWSGPRFFGL